MTQWKEGTEGLIAYLLPVMRSSLADKSLYRRRYIFVRFLQERIYCQPVGRSSRILAERPTYLTAKGWIGTLPANTAMTYAAAA